MRVAALLVLGLLQSGCIDDLSPLEGIICTAGDVLCNADGVRVCKGDGTKWLPSACLENQVCVPDAPCEAGPTGVDCPGACKDKICEPGSSICSGDNIFISVCDDTGTQAQICQNCADEPYNGLCYEGTCVSLCDVEQKSYLGCEFFAVDLDNAFVPCGVSFGIPSYCDAASAQFAIVVSNPSAEDSAFVSITNGPVGTTGGQEGQEGPEGHACRATELDSNFVDQTVLPPKGIAVFQLPQRDVTGTVQQQLAYRVASNIPITAYQFNPLENEQVFSNDASLLLPTNTAGRFYMVMTREQTFDDLKGYVTIVGVANSPTTVTVQVTAPTLSGDGIPALSPGQTFITRLSAYEVLNIESNLIGSDLTGTTVRSDRPVIVFGGSEAADAPNTSTCNLETKTCVSKPSVPCDCVRAGLPSNCNPHTLCYDVRTCCADHLEEQLFPVSVWGKEYIGVRSYPRAQEPDVWRVLAAHDNTQLVIQPASVELPVLNAGQWFEWESGQDFIITGSEPFMLGQFLAAEQSPNPGVGPEDAGTGDPAFMVVAPTRQFRRDYVFLAPDEYGPRPGEICNPDGDTDNRYKCHPKDGDYVSIAAPVTATVYLDGRQVPSGNPLQLHVEIEGQDADGIRWQAIRVRIDDGFHLLDCSEPCGLMVHGYDQYVSYGYPGGLNLAEEEAE